MPLFAFPETLTIHNAKEISEELKKLALTANDPVILDASRTDAITTPGIQLILSLERSAEEAGAKLALRNLKDNLRPLFDVFGLKEKLAIWETSHE